MICINICYRYNCCILQTHYFEFQLTLYKNLLHAIATQPLTNNTLPAPQKTKLDILPLPPLLFDKRVHNIKIDKCPLLGNDRRSLEWESGFLPIFSSSEESNQDFYGDSSLPQPLSCLQAIVMFFELIRSRFSCS